MKSNMKETGKKDVYKQAGVDIDAAADLVESIKPHIRKTNRSGVLSAIGGFGALFDPKAAGYTDPILVSSTDGVGTKIKIAIDTNRHETIGIDLVAMCVNDLLVQGAEPLFFLDYFATGKLDNKIGETVIAGIAKGCELAGCALVGGETAEMPGLYADGDYDLAGFTVGAVERTGLISGDTIEEGDIIIGLASSGVHSNGYSLVRKIIKDANIKYSDPIPFPCKDGLTTYADVLLTPTRIYVKSILGALKILDNSGKPAIRGMAHITGGGLTENIPRVLPSNMAAYLDANCWTLPDIFCWLRDTGNIADEYLARTLNCGIGMVLICNPAFADNIVQALEQSGEDVFRIGRIKANTNSNPHVVIENTHLAWRTSY